MNLCGQVTCSRPTMTIHLRPLRLLRRRIRILRRRVARAPKRIVSWAFSSCPSALIFGDARDFAGGMVNETASSVPSSGKTSGGRRTRRCPMLNGQKIFEVNVFLEATY